MMRYFIPSPVGEGKGRWMDGWEEGRGGMEW